MSLLMKWVIGAAVALSALFAVLTQLVLPQAVKQIIPSLEKTAAEYINGSVTVGDALWPGSNVIVLKDVKLKNREAQTIAELPETRLTLNPLQAATDLGKAVTDIVLENPVVYLRENKEAHWNFENLMKPSQSDTAAFYGKIKVQDGQVNVEFPEGKWQYSVNGTLDGLYNPDFDLDFQVDAAGMETAKVTGRLTTKGTGRVNIQCSGVDLKPYAPLALRYGKVKEAAGRVVAIDAQWRSNGEDSLLEGRCELQEVQGSYTVGSDPLHFRITGPVSAVDHIVTAENLMVALDEQVAYVSAKADISDLENPKGHAEFTSDQLTYGGETARNIKAEAVLENHLAAVNHFAADYGGGTITGRLFYDLKKGQITGQGDLRNVTLAGEKTAQETVLVNAALAGDGTYDREKGTLKVNIASDVMNLRWRDLVLNVLDFDTDVTEKGAEIRNFSAFSGSGALQATGKISYDGAYDLRGRMGDMPLAPILAAFGETGSGLFSSDFHIYGQGSRLNFAGQTGLRQAVYRDLVIKEGHGSLEVHDGVAQISEYMLTLNQGRHVANGTIDLRGEEPVADLTVHTENVRIEPLLSLLPPEQRIRVTGNLTNTLTIRGAMSRPLVTGDLHMFDGSVDGYLVEDIRGRYRYQNEILTLDDVVLKAVSTTVKLNGQMDADGRLDVNASATDVDLSRLPLREEDLALTGYASFSGRLRGTKEQPLFDGTVHSDLFTLNGVEVTQLQGTLQSNGKDINVLKGGFRQNGTDNVQSDYNLDLSLNMPARDLRGTVNVSHGDLKNILKMARRDYPVSGIADGTVTFNGAHRDTLLQGKLSNLAIHDVKYDSLVMQARFNRGLLTLDEARLLEHETTPDKGFIAAGGQIDLEKRTLHLEAGAIEADPAVLTAFMKNPVELKGRMNIALQLEGSLDNPSGNGSLEILGGSLEGGAFDRAIAMLTLKNDHINLEQMLVEEGGYKLTAAGNIPLDLFRSTEQRHNPRAQMNIDVDFNEADLAALTAFKEVEWGIGKTEGKVKIAGTLETPHLYGNLGIKDGTVKFRDIYTPVDKINANIVFAGQKIDINRVSAVLGRGTVEGSGTYDLMATDANAYRLEAKANNAEIDSSYFKGRINGTFSAAPEYFRSRSRKQAGWRPKVTADVRLDDVLINMPTIPQMSGGDSNLGLDVTLALGPKIRLYNKYLYDLWLKGGLKITGSTVFPRIEGSIESEKGTVTYLRTRFKLDKGSLNWIEPGTFLPNLRVNAHTRFSRYRVFMELTGPLSGDNLNLVLRSDPPLPQNTLVRMLTLQRLSAGSDDVTNEDLHNLLIAGLETGLLGDVEYMVKKVLGIDDFRVYVGRVENGLDFDNRMIRELTKEEKSQYNFLVGKNLTGRWKIGYTASFNGLYSNIFTQYQVSDRVNLTLSRDENHNHRYSVEYRITF